MRTSILYIYRIATAMLPESRCYNVKNALLRLAGAKIGSHVRIYSSACITGSGALDIGDDVHIGTKTVISCAAPATIRIGSHVDIAPNVTIVSGSHRITPDGDHIGGEGFSKDIKINDGTWIGTGAVILQGVEIPCKSVVAAGAVVAKSVPQPCSLLAGVPAQVKKNIFGGLQIDGKVTDIDDGLDFDQRHGRRRFYRC